MDLITEMIIGWLQGYPFFGTIIVILGITRAVIKPFMSFVNALVNATPSPNDNSWWASIEASEGMKFFLYILDWTTSIKIKPKARKIE